MSRAKSGGIFCPATALHVVTLAAVIAVVAVFAVLGRDSVAIGAHENVEASLRAVEAVVRSRLERTAATVRGVEGALSDANDWCNDGRNNTEAMRPFMRLSLATMVGQPEIFSLHTTYRMQRRSGAPATSTAPSDFTWNDCGCTNPLNKLALFCVMGIDRYGNNTPGMVLMGNTFPGISTQAMFTITADSWGQPYTSEVARLTEADRVLGMWAAPYPFVPPGAAAAVVGLDYSLPVQFDPTSGDAVLALSATLDAAPMMAAVEALNLTSTSVSLFDHASGRLIFSTDAAVVAAGQYAQLDVVDVFAASSWNASDTPSERLNDAVAAIGGLGALTENDQQILRLDQGPLVGARRFSTNPATRAFVAVTVTDPALHFRDFNVAQIAAAVLTAIAGVAIVAGIAILCVSLRGDGAGDAAPGAAHKIE